MRWIFICPNLEDRREWNVLNRFWCWNGVECKGLETVWQKGEPEPTRKEKKKNECEEKRKKSESGSFENCFAIKSSNFQSDQFVVQVLVVSWFSIVSTQNGRIWSHAFYPRCFRCRLDFESRNVSLFLFFSFSPITRCSSLWSTKLNPRLAIFFIFHLSEKT